MGPFSRHLKSHCCCLGDKFKVFAACIYFVTLLRISIYNMIHSIFALLTSLFISSAQAADIKMFCKCFCGSNSTVFEIPVIDPKPCANCTKQFCLDNVKDGICDGIADSTCPSNDFKTACFGKFIYCEHLVEKHYLISFEIARDSYKDEIIVRSFLIITIGLVLFALIKPFFDKWQKVKAIYVAFLN